MPAELDHPKVLVIDDEPDLRTLYEVSLVREGYIVHCAEGVEQAIAALQHERFDAVISDMRLQDGLGLDVLRYITQAQRSERCVVITAYGSAENAVEALKAGAFDYLTKPVDLKQFRSVLAQAVRSTQLSQAPTLQQPSAQSSASLEAPGPDPDSLEAIMTAPKKVLAAPALPVPASVKAKSLAVPAPASAVALASEPTALLRMVGNSASMQAVRDRVQKVARSMAPVLVRGESGTGKELVAKAVHACSHRASGPFVAVNCGAIPEQLLEAEFFGARKGAYTGATQDREGYFQAANGGTLFLDEIGDLPLAMQAKLLRAIQERSVRALGGTQEEAVDTRIVSATHHDLAAQVAKGLFRQDLYYRLNVIEISLPALRERRSDIPMLAQALLARIAADAGLAPRTVSGSMLAALQRNDLLGNVRELENILHRALALSDGDELELEDHDMQCGSLESAPPELGAVFIDIPAIASSPACVPSDLQSHLDIQEKAILLQALTECGFNRTAAAARLGISLRQIRYRMVRLGIDAQITAQQGSQQDIEQA